MHSQIKQCTITSSVYKHTIRHLSSQSSSQCSKYQCLFRRQSNPVPTQHKYRSSLTFQSIHIRTFATAVAAATSPFAETVTCWKCDAPIIPGNALTCVQCGCTQLRALEVDHFTLFGMLVL